jgi:UDP-glucose 4-epimerase
MRRGYLVTGGAGFIGSHLVDRLIGMDQNVVALDDLSTGRLSNLERAQQSPRFKFVEGSILDQELVGGLVRDCDVVVHLAAAVGVKLIVERPLESLTTNIRGSENVLEAAERNGRKVLLASTSEIYGKNTSDGLAETADRILGSPTVARWAYSTAKAVDEILAYAYYKERNLPTIVVRLFNTVGPRQSPAYGMVMPRLVGQAVRGEPLTVYGDGKQTRCFCHVADTVEALVGLLGCEDAVGDVFNVGAGEEISILDLADRVIAGADSRSEVKLIPYDVAYETGFEDMLRRVPDTGKIRALTGWRPQRTLDDILAEMVQEAKTGRVEIVPRSV